MTLDEGGIVYGGLGVQKSWGRAWGLEALLVALSPSDKQGKAIEPVPVKV